MSTTYEHTTTTTSSGQPEIGVDNSYPTSIPGILKIAECVLDLVAFICASIVIWWGQYGGGWVQFVTISAFITTLVWFIFHLLRIIYRFPGPWLIIVLSLVAFICAIVWVNWSPFGGGWVQFVTISAFVSTLILLILHLMRVVYRIGNWLLIEFIYYIVYTLLLLIAAIVAAARGSWHASIVACAIFTFAATVVYAVDTFFMFNNWKSGRTTTMETSGGAVVTTTTTQYESKTQY